MLFRCVEGSSTGQSVRTALLVSGIFKAGSGRLINGGELYRVERLAQVKGDAPRGRFSQRLTMNDNFDFFFCCVLFCCVLRWLVELDALGWQP
nr:unnamed protein product [Haemonchus contortus]